MNKKTLQLAVLLVILAGIVAAVLLLNQEPALEEGEPPAGSGVYALGGVPQPFVKEIHVQNGLDAFTIQNDNENIVQQTNSDTDNYSVAGIAPEWTSASLLKGAMTTAASLEAKQVIAESGADLSLYGLESPRATLQVVYEEGSATMLIGDEAPGAAGTYVAVGDTVYLVSSSGMNSFLTSRYGYVDKTVTGGNSQISTFSRVTLTGERYGEEPIVVVQADEDDQVAVMMGYGSYYIAAPIQAGIDYYQGLTPLMKVFGITATAVMGEYDPAQEDSLALWNLLEPEVTVEAVTQDETIGSFTLHISQEDAEGFVYLYREDSPYIYQAVAAELDFLNLTVFDLQDKAVHTVNIDTVSQLVVETGEGTTTFSLVLEDDGEGNPFTSGVEADGQALDLDNFKQFYQTVVSARADSEVGGGDIPLQDGGEEPIPEDAGDSREEDAGETPERVLLRYTFRYREGGEDTVTFSAATARRVIVRKNDGAPYYVQSVYVDGVLEDLPKLLAGEDITARY